MDNFIPKDSIIEFLEQSNFIEGVSGSTALDDAFKAWSFLCNKSLTINNILKAHGILMGRLAPRLAGKFRNCNVRVGNHVAPDTLMVSGLTSEWLKKYKYAETEEEIKQAHIDFETIHPFEDGNGRIGRIIMNYQRIRTGHSILIIQESDRFDYYMWFKDR